MDVEVLGSFIEGLGYLGDPQVWLLVTIGMLVGLTFGIIPGLSSIVGMSVLLPFIFLMDPEIALPLFIGVMAVAPTGGSITSVLLNVPGTPVNAATLLDGYPMTQKGEGSRALGAALWSSGMGGIIGCVFALIMVPLVLPIIYEIRSGDMVFMMFMGLAFISVLSRGSTLRGIIAAGLGLMLAYIGNNVVTGVSRYTFDTVYLINGLPIIGLVLGLFAMPEMIALAAKGGTIAQVKDVNLSFRGVWQGVTDVFRHWGLWLRSSIIGYVVGVIPGIGAATATWIAYGQAKQLSKTPERFGKGAVEGVIAPEACNNAKEGGALLTTLALGIPGSAEMVIMLSALMMVGVRPGPEMLTLHLPLSFSLLQVLFVGSFLGALVCLLAAPRLAKIALIPARILVPIVIVVVFIGSFAHDEQFLDLVVLLVFTIIGLAAKKYDFNRPAIVLGFILGDLIEKYLFLSVGTAGPFFFLRPISLSIFLLIVLLFAWGPLTRFIRSMRKGGTS